MSTFTLNPSEQALLDTEFVRKDDRGIAEARMIKFGVAALCVLTLALLAVFGVKVYYLLNGFVERHVGPITTVLVVIHGKKYVYQYCGPRRFVRFVKRQVLGHK